MRNFLIGFIICGILASCILGAVAVFLGDKGEKARDDVIQVESAMAQPPVEISAIHITTVLYGLRAALMDRPGTLLMTNGSQVMTAWYDAGKWFFTGFQSSNGMVIENIATVLPESAQCIDCYSMSAWIAFLEKNGWKTITSKEVPEIIKLAIMSQSASVLMQVAAGKLINVFIVPVLPGMIPEPLPTPPLS